MAESKKMSFWERMQDIDRRILSWLLVIVIITPLIYPIGLPIASTAPTRDLYNAIEALPEGSLVLFNIGMGPTTWTITAPQAIAFLRHLIRKQAKIVFMGAAITVAIDYDKLVSEVKDLQTYEYGKDYVFLGYLPGMETGFVTIATNFRAVFQTDYYGTPVDDIEIMKNVNSCTDFDYLVAVEGGGSQPIYMLAQWVIPYDIPMGMAGGGIIMSWFPAYYDSGLLDGYMNDLKGAAEYEMLLNRPGYALGRTDGINTSQLLIIFSIIVGNIGFLYEKQKGGK